MEGNGSPRTLRVRLLSRCWATALLLLGAIGVESAIMLRWIGLNGWPAQPVCCDFVGPVLDLNRLGYIRYLKEGPLWDLSPGLAIALAERVHWLSGGDPDFPLYSQLMATIVGQLAIFEIGRRLSGSGAGLLAAILLPIVPVIAFMERRWDAYLLDMIVVEAGVLAMLLSDGYRRFPPILLFLGLISLGALMSPRFTDSAMVVTCLLSVAAASGLRTLILGRGLDGRPLARWRGLIWFAIMIAVACALREFLLHGNPARLAYYRGEMALPAIQAPQDRWDWQALTAYVGHLYWRGLTPWLAIPFDVALVAWLWRGRGRAEIGAWLAGLTLILSLLEKKNFYYLSPIYPAIPLVIALGVGTLRWRPARIGFSLLVLGIAWTQYLSRAFPESFRGTPLDGFRWDAGDDRYGGLFQFGDDQLDLAPLVDPCPGQPEDVIEAMLVFDPCEPPIAVATVDMPDSFLLRYRLAVDAPCIEIRDLGTEAWDDPTATADVGMILVPIGPDDSPSRHADRSQSLQAFIRDRVEGNAYVAASVVPVCGEEVQVLLRPPDWFESRREAP